MMLTALVLASTLAMADPLEGDGIQCSDPNFSFVKSGTAAILSGTVRTPQQGFNYSFQMLGAERGIAAAVISAGQPINYNGFGRAPLSIGQLVVKEKFAVPENLIQLNVRIEGLSRKPQEFICTLSAPKRPA